MPNPKKTKGEVRHLLAAPSQEARAEKRQTFVLGLQDVPRHEGQNFLEQKAVWDDTANTTCLG